MINYFKSSKFFLYLVPLGVVLVTKSTLFPFIVGKYTWFRTNVFLAFIFFLLGLLFSKEFKFYERRLIGVLKSPLTIAVLVFAVSFLLACFFSVDPSYSFWSNFERGEGGLQIIGLFIFFILTQVLFKEKKDWHKMFVMVIIAALGMIGYGVLAGLKYPGFIGPAFGEPGFRFQGSIGNPAYVASYLIFALFFAIYLFIDKARIKLKDFRAQLLILSSLCFLIFFFLAATRGAFVGLGVGILVGLMYLVFSQKKWRKPIIATGLVFMILSSAAVYFINTYKTKDALISKFTFLRVFDLSFYATTFQHRMIMWGIAWKGFLEKPVFGWGPEMYIKIFEKHYNPDYYKPEQGGNFGAWFDRAHSIYFDYLAETGFFGFISFISIFIVFFVQFFRLYKINIRSTGVKDKNKNQTIAPDYKTFFLGALILDLPISYLIQGFVLFDVLPIYISLYIFLAFASYMFIECQNDNPKLKVQNAKLQLKT